jgi:hypothetical protein
VFGQQSFRFLFAKIPRSARDECRLAVVDAGV